MSQQAFILCLCGFTLVAHVGLLFMRGWLIGQIKREQDKMKKEWEAFNYEQEQWRKRFEEEHQSPWYQKRHIA